MLCMGAITSPLEGKVGNAEALAGGGSFARLLW
jgi:hypothetical protein